MKETAKVRIPPKLHSVLVPPLGAAQYRAAYGGRGSGKSFSFALMAAVRGYVAALRILCTREFQISIRESFYAELRAAIETYDWLRNHYRVGSDYIRGANGTEFIFRGLRRNERSIASLAKIDLTIVEEAEDIPESSWRTLEPTIFRQPNSELWVIWNPLLDGSPVDNRFIKNPPDSLLIAKLNHSDNPWFPVGLEQLRRREQERLDPATYAHVWEGEYLENSDAQVLAGKVKVQEFEPGEGWEGPYYGLDFGFSQDPTAAVECWLYDDTVYIYREAGGVGIELDDTPAVLKRAMPGIENYVVEADSARPESIAHLRKHGLPRIKAAKKWSGSIQDGISWLRGRKTIVIHPQCRESIKESRLYSHKVDRHTGYTMPDIIDAHNHRIDAVRYAFSPMIAKPKKMAGTW